LVSGVTAGIEAVRIPLGGTALDGDLTVPERAVGVVAFAHGSGSSRLSPRNRRVAETLQGAGVGTLLIDLLTAEEEQVDLVTAESRFDIELLTTRLHAAIGWLGQARATRTLPIGLFGASTGAAAALVAAARLPALVRAVVSRGGRPDLAGDAALGSVQAPTLLIVGERDDVVLELNRTAAAQLMAEHVIEVVPGATHLFEEPGALDRVAALAADWFGRHLRTDGT
jgi:putative phosphoribosyl transferase